MSEIDYSYFLSWIAIKLPVFFSYFMPWIGLSSSLFACAVLYLSKHSEVTPVIFIFKWQYVIGVIYALNMIFNDPMFTSSLFPYNPNEFVSNAFCKVQTIIMHFFYCISPWIQVVITFDRLWVCYLKETIRISRNKMTLFLVILVAFGLILLSSFINAWFFIVKIETYQDIFNSTLNKTIHVNATVYRCLQSNDDFALVQDILFNVMRVGLPFVIIFVSNIALLWYVHTLRNSVARAINHNSRQRRENNFTIAVCSKNLAFLVLSICYFAYAIIAYALKFSGVLESFSQLQLVQFVLFQRISTLLSYMYTLIEFWVELIFNRIFRAEILRALKKIDTMFRRARN